MEDPVFLRLLNRIQGLEDDLQVELDRRERLERRHNVIRHELDFYKRKCSRAWPDLESAKRGMGELPTSSISEIKCFRNPPARVITVASCLALLLEGLKHDYWTAARRIFSDASVFSLIKDFDPETLSNAEVREVKRKLRGCYLAETESVSSAAACLHRWILDVLDYWQTYSTIKPYADKITELQTEKGEVLFELGEVMKHVDTLEINVRHQAEKKRRLLSPPLYLHHWAVPRSSLYF